MVSLVLHITIVTLLSHEAAGASACKALSDSDSPLANSLAYVTATYSINMNSLSLSNLLEPLREISPFLSMCGEH